MNQAQFIIQSKNWIYHKLMLSVKSQSYQQDKNKKNAVLNVRILFTNFLNYPNKYSVGQIALMLKRNEGLLETILPIPSNPSYEKSLLTLKSLLIEAEQIIKHYNLSL